MQGFWGREGRASEYAYQPVAGYPEYDASEAVEDTDAVAETSLFASTPIQPTPNKSLPSPHTSRSSLAPAPSIPLLAAPKYATRGTQTVAPNTRVYTAIRRPEAPPHLAQIRMNDANLRPSPRPGHQNNIDVEIELQPLQCTHRHRYPPGIVVIKMVDDDGEEVVEETCIDGDGSRDGGRRCVESKEAFGAGGRKGLGWVGGTWRAQGKGTAMMEGDGNLDLGLDGRREGLRDISGI